MPSAAAICGLVLTGGASRRMGRDKAALTLAGESLLERTVRLLSLSLGQVYVSVNPAQLADGLRRRFQLIADDPRDAGPAAGILAAHQRDPKAAWLVVACDMPGLADVHIERLLRERDPARDATVWQGARGESLEPLCAIYEPATLAGFREYVRAARGNSPRDWLMGRDIKVLTGPQAADLRSTNTPEDFETMLAASTEAGGDTADNNEQENSDETQ